MIVVTAELLSAISPDRDDRLCTVHISNDASIPPGPRGSYDVQLFSRGDYPRLIRSARIENWPREAQPAWRLIAEAFRMLDA